jgi:hypothetical protein
MTDQGRSDAEFLLLVNNNIMTISTEELTTFRSVLDSSTYATTLVIPLSDSYKKAEEGSSILTKQDKSRTKKSNNTAGIVSAFVLLAGVVVALGLLM